VPLYEHQCPKCGRKFEKLHKKISCRAKRCPTCRVMSPQVPSSWGAISWGKSGHWNKGA
jgi:putative FmdB family regulatory protein